MPLAPGTRLGPYVLQSLLGSGGMGEVYRAEDSRLRRTVAFKVLRSEVATPDRVARFEQEARAASSLNHPNILTIHDVLAAFAARAHPEEARARQWMTAEPVTLEEGSSWAEAARVMRTVGVHHLPLVEDGRPVGMVHLDAETPDVVPAGLGF